ncbi:MAG: hypothetical protein V3V08_04295 [Nannocystaceae bacterium]
MPATSTDTSIDTLERSANYEGGEISPESLRADLKRRLGATAAAVDMLGRLMDDNRGLRSELVDEQRVSDEFAAHVVGDAPDQDPRAWSSGVRKMVGYAPGQASMAVSERSIDSWLKQIHQSLSGRIEKMRQRVDPYSDRARALDATLENLVAAAAEATRNRELALHVAKQLAALALQQEAAEQGAQRRAAALVRHARQAETFSLAATAYSDVATCVRSLAEAMRQIIQRIQTHETTAERDLARARSAILGVDWSVTVHERRPATTAALESLQVAVRGAADFVGDTQILARQGLARWTQLRADAAARVTELQTRLLAPFENDAVAAARHTVTTSP